MDSLENLNEDKYIVNGNDHVPTVILDKVQNKFEISGVSLPEDIMSFYFPIFKWLDLYKKAPNKKTIVVFKMVYINSASSKMIEEIIKKFEEIFVLGNEVEIHWQYNIEDEEMLSDGRIFLENKSMPYQLIHYTS